MTLSGIRCIWPRRAQESQQGGGAGGRESTRRLCHVYARREWLLVTAMSRTVDGFWVACPPYLRLDRRTATPEEVGAAVETALEGSRDMVATPDWSGPSPLQPLFELAKVRSWSTFVRGARLVGVEQEGEAVRVTPQRNEGAREGFSELELLVRVMARGEAGDLGRQVLASLEKAE